MPQERLLSKTHRFYVTVWEYKVKKLFQKLDFELPNGEFSVKNTLANLKILLDQNYQEEWHHGVFNDKNCQNGMYL